MIPGPHNEEFLRIAETCKPELRRTTTKPLHAILVEKDDKALMGWSARPDDMDGEQKVLKKGESVVFDFGGHRTGYFEYDIEGVQNGVEPPDAPARLKIVFGEVLNDVAESFDDYKAWISPSWLPDEIVNIDYLPSHEYMPRRHAFRYVKIEVISTSLRFGVSIRNPLAHAVTSAPEHDPPELSFASKSGMSDEDKALFRRIDQVSLLTLRNCMQTVYEDGPRRDMRLWIGDLRLQALCSYATFKDYDLAKRCLYLFAAMPFNSEGLLAACLYEKPTPHFGGNSIVDYSMLYGVTLLDYVKATGDTKTGHDLFAISHKQFSFFLRNFNDELRYIIPERSMADGGEGWHFVDWEPTLHKEAAEVGIMIFCLKAILELASLLKIEAPALQLGTQEVSTENLITELTKAHRKHYFDASSGAYISGPDKQISWASASWAVIAGIPESNEAAAKAMSIAYNDKQSVKGMTPYLHHYLCEALILAGLEDTAVSHIKRYWGSMIEAGGETFFEAWNPDEPRVSPYGDLHSNSFCHAWSCTPALLLRQLGYA